MPKWDYSYSALNRGNYMPGAVTGTPRTLLRLEAILVAFAALIAYARLGANWWLFAALFFVPDLSLLGYQASRKAGAALYNVRY